MTRTPSKTTTKMTSASLVGLFCLLTILVVDAGPAAAQESAAGRPSLEELATELELTPAQERQIQTLRVALAGSLRDQNARSRALRTQLARAWRADDPNERIIASLMRRLADVREEIHQQQLRYRYAALGVLTPEQRQRLTELYQESAQRPLASTAASAASSGGGRSGIELVVPAAAQLLEGVGTVARSAAPLWDLESFGR